MNLKLTTKETSKLREHAQKMRHFYGANSEAFCKAEAAIASLENELAAPINDALHAVNGKATAHTITRGQIVIDAAHEAEAQLAASGVPLNERAGLTATFKPTIDLPNAYSRKGSNTVISTLCHMKRVADGWRLTRVERIEPYTKSKGGVLITLDEHRAEIVQKAAIANYRIA